MTDGRADIDAITARTDVLLGTAVAVMGRSGLGAQITSQQDPSGAVSFSLKTGTGLDLPLLTLNRLLPELEAGPLLGSTVADTIYTAAMQRRHVWAAPGETGQNSTKSAAMSLRVDTQLVEIVKEALSGARSDLSRRLGFEVEEIEVTAGPVASKRTLHILHGDLLVAAAHLPLPSEHVSPIDPLILRMRSQRSGEGAINSLAIDPQRLAYRAFVEARPDEEQQLDATAYICSLLQYHLFAERGSLLTHKVQAAIIFGARRAAPRHTRWLMETLGYETTCEVLRHLLDQGLVLQPMVPILGALVDATRLSGAAKLPTDAKSVTERARLHLGTHILRALGLRSEVSGVEVRFAQGADAYPAPSLAAAIENAPSDPPRILTEQADRRRVEDLARRIDPTTVVIGFDEIPATYRTRPERIVVLK